MYTVLDVIKIAKNFFFKVSVVSLVENLLSLCNTLIKLTDY